jgi:hypothetical protein
MESLVVSPDSELVFAISTGQSQIKQTMLLDNQLNTAVAFKVKTTAPKLFSVRPSSGVLVSTTNSGPETTSHYSRRAADKRRR